VTLRARWVTLRAWFCDVCRHGAAGNTNFSTARMRRPGGMEHIEAAIASLQRRHTVHMAEYGGGARFRRSDPRNTLDVRLPRERARSERAQGGVGIPGAVRTLTL
jgi:hypothetical protein